MATRYLYGSLVLYLLRGYPLYFTYEGVTKGSFCVVKVWSRLLRRFTKYGGACGGEVFQFLGKPRRNVRRRIYGVPIYERRSLILRMARLRVLHPPANFWRPTN